MSFSGAGFLTHPVPVAVTLREYGFVEASVPSPRFTWVGQSLCHSSLWILNPDPECLVWAGPFKGALVSLLHTCPTLALVPVDLSLSLSPHTPQAAYIYKRLLVTLKQHL